MNDRIFFFLSYDEKVSNLIYRQLFNLFCVIKTKLKSSLQLFLLFRFVVGPL